MAVKPTLATIAELFETPAPPSPKPQEIHMTMIEHEPEPNADQAETETVTQPPRMAEITEIDSPAEAMQRARALIPVSQGAQPINFAQQVDFAKTMAQARCALPKHLQGNPGDCLAIIDIAQAAGFSPYMVANKTYVGPGGRLEFESQLYHAFVIKSNRLKDGALHVKYDGEGDDMTCTVWGTLRGEATPRYHTSSILSKLRPRAVVGKDGNEYVKGSPLWLKKITVQMFYDTSRDWARMFCPIATLGLLAQYEQEETPVNQFQEQTLVDRLKNGDKTEGHQNGHAAEELNKVAADNTTLKPSGEATKIKPAKADKKPAAKPPADENRATTLEKDKPATKKQASAAADRAQALSDARKREADEKKAAAAAPKPEQKTDDPPPQVPTKPKNDAEYQVYAMDWIERASDPEEALKRWDAERDTRDDIVVRTKTRNMLRAELERKHGV